MFLFPCGKRKGSLVRDHIFTQKSAQNNPIASQTELSIPSSESVFNCMYATIQNKFRKQCVSYFWIVIVTNNVITSKMDLLRKKIFHYANRSWSSL